MKLGKLKLILPLVARKSINLVDGAPTRKGYYFLNNNNSNVLWYNHTFNTYKIIFNNTLYCSICYDCKENCLWAIDKCSNKLYKLNLNMSKISCVPINIYTNYNDIRNLSYNKDNNNLILTTKNKIIEISKAGNIIDTPNDLKGVYCYLSSYYLYHNIFSLWCYRNYYYISISDSSNDITFYKLPKHFKFKTIILARYIQSHNTCLIYLLANCKKNCDHLICIALNDCYLKRNCNYNIQDNPSYNDKNDDYNHNFERHNHNYNHHCNLKESKCAILNSIALQEVGLSNIINMEGEKLQKAISLAKNTNDLLKVNSSVDKLITNITVLENLLYSKLKSILDKD